MSNERIRLPPLREALGLDEPKASDPYAALPHLSTSTPRGLRGTRSHAQLPSPISTSGYSGPSLTGTLSNSYGASGFSSSTSNPSRRLASFASSRQLRHPNGQEMNRLGGGSRGRLGSGFVPNLAPISSHSLQRQTSMENLRPLESTLMHHSSRAAFPPAPTNLPYREPANIDPFSSPLPSISPPPHIGYIQSQSTSTPSPSYTSYRQTPPNLSYGSSSYFAGPSTPLASAPRDADPAASANTPQFSSLQLASPYTTHFDRSSQSGSQNLPPLLPLMPQPDNRGMLNSGSTGEDGREPYVLPLHPYGSDGFLDDALAHGPAPPRHAFRRRRSEASLSPPPLSSGSSGGFGSTSSARTSPHPHSHTDPFDPLPAHDFTHQGTSAPRRTEAGHALRGQRSLIVPSSRSRRYLPPPNPLESLIGSSGMLQSADASSSSINIPGLGGTHAGSQPARYACELCGKGFTRPSALAIHMNSHTGTRPYTCQYCGKDFSVASNLRRHMKIHEGLDDMPGQNFE